MIEYDPPLFANPTNDPYWQGPVTLQSNSTAIADGMIVDQLARLKAENARQSSRIAFLEAALETALAENDFKPVPPDSTYYAREVAPRMRQIEENAAANAFDRALRLPNTPDPYGR